MPVWLKRALLGAGIVTLCWGGAIAYWRTAANSPATGDLLLALLAAPLGLLLAVWLGKKAVFARPRAAAATGTAATAQPAASPIPSAPPLALLAAALRAPHGASPEELAAAIAANKARPDLDPELVDDDGFPVFSARSDAALDDALKDEISEWLMLTGMAELHLSDAQWRALILGTAVVRDLASEALMQLMPAQGAAPPLRLLPILPVAWTVEQRHAVGLWFRHTVAQFGWPVDKLTRIEVSPEPGTALSAAFQIQPGIHGAPPVRQATIVIACESNIDQATVDTWATNRTLFTPSQPQGCVPGEGAAGLLMINLDHAQSLPDVTYALLDPFKEVRLPPSVKEKKRPDMKLLSSLAQRVCKEANVDMTIVGMIAADTGQPANRVQELMAMASSEFPHLDDKADIACVGISSGSCGAVPYVTALAVAQYQACARGEPVLYVSNEEAHIRYATLVRPIVPLS